MRMIMDYEKKYKEALEKAREWYNKTEPDSYTCIVESIFPELKESEDERIRKELVNYFTEGREFLSLCSFGRDKILAWLEKQESLTTDEEKQWKEDVLWCIKQAKKYAKDENEMGTCWFAEQWLEKQGQKKYINDLTQQEAMDIAVAKCFNEQEAVDKVESKFKVGYWYQCTKDFFGKGVTFDKNTAYYCAKEGCLQDEYGCHIAIVKDLYDNFKLWTLQDAKDGDVLYSLDSNQPFIYKERNIHKRQVTAYCGINKYGNFFVWNTKDCIITLDKYIPATQEQRDKLEKAMLDAGYKWNANEKKLEKIEQKKQRIISAEAKEAMYGKPTWSEEDENNLTDTCVAIRKFYHGINGAQELIDWMQSLKERMKGEKA